MLACGLQVGGRSHAGTVLDLSPGGLLVETLASLDALDEVEVQLRWPDWKEPVTLRAAPVRSYPPSIDPVSGRRAVLGGIGLKVIQAPPLYGSLFGYGVVEKPAPPARAEAPAADALPGEPAQPISSPPEPDRGTLPPLQAPTRVACRACRRDDRPVWGGICAWCQDR
jgi:hypothetical protein